MIEKDELIKKINTVLAEEFEVEEHLIQPEKILMQTLSLDSLDLVDMVVLIENNFGFKFTGEDFMKISTFQSFYDYMYEKLKEMEAK
jgi:acyl carrier protein